MPLFLSAEYPECFVIPYQGRAIQFQDVVLPVGIGDNTATGDGGRHA